MSDSQYGDVLWRPEISVLCCGDREERLTRRQGQIWVALLRANGAARSQEQLIRALWGMHDTGPLDGEVKVIICRLRRTLRSLNAQLQIRTAWGIGYRLYVPSVTGVTALLSTEEWSEVQRRRASRNASTERIPA